MGNSSGRKTFNVPENQKIFDLLNDMHTKERLFKTFCAKFEYKIYKKPLDEKKFEISWEDFNVEMLNNFSDFEENYVSYILLETFRKYFQYHNNSLRIFKVYMIYFPLVLHLKGSEGLNFLELIFEKVIYNLEIEMSEGNREYHIQDIEKSSMDETKTDRSDMISQTNIIDKSTNRKLLDNTFRGKKQISSEENPKIKKSENFVNSIDHKLLISFSEYFRKKDLKKKFLRTIPINIFKEIIVVYFHSVITLFLRAFKDTIREFTPNKRYEDILIKNMSYYRHENISYSELSEENVEKFIKNTLEKFIERRDTLKAIEYNKIILTYDDVYAFFIMNSYFIDSYRTHEIFLRFIGK